MFCTGRSASTGPALPAHKPCIRLFCDYRERVNQSCRNREESIVTIRIFGRGYRLNYSSIFFSIGPDTRKGDASIFSADIICTTFSIELKIMSCSHSGKE